MKTIKVGLAVMVLLAACRPDPDKDGGVDGTADAAVDAGVHVDASVPVDAAVMDAAQTSDAAVMDAAQTSDAAVHADDGGMDGGILDAAVMADASAGDAGTVSLTVLETLADYQSLQGTTNEVKFLGQVTGVTPQSPVLEPCLFQNTRLYPYHLLFLRTYPEHAQMTNQQYTALVLRPATRVWWGGGVQRWTNRTHPITGQPEVMVYSIYAENAGSVGLTEANIREVDALLKGCIPFATQTLAFLPSDPYQVMLARQVQAALAQDGIGIIIP